MSTSKTSSTRKMSLYRLRSDDPPDLAKLRSFVVPKYLSRPGFATQQVDHEGISGLVISGTTFRSDDAEWCTPLSRLTGVPISAQNRTAMALLLLRTEKHIYGLTCGMGNHLLDATQIDSTFGIEFAVRSLDEERITKIRRQVMDTRGRADENSATGGEHIRAFGIEKFGEIISHLSGKTIELPLTCGRRSPRSVQVAVSDRSIKLDLGITPDDLLHDLDQIEQVCTRPPQPEFEFITNIRPLKPKSEQAQRLDEQLDVMLGADETPKLALAVPSECRDHFDFAESFTYGSSGSACPIDELTAESLRAAVQKRPEGRRLSMLRQRKIQIFADAAATEEISRAIHADHWITAEVSDGNSHFFLWQRQWYEIGAEYVDVIESGIAELLSRPTSIALPSWPAGKNEGWFNEEIAKQPGYLLLDKKQVHTQRFTGGGLEMADALGPDGQLICVKKSKGTAPLNHLFAQGRVAVETLRFDADAREKLLAKIPEDHPVDRSFRSPTVVYAILLKDGEELTTKSLFAFAMVSLFHTAKALERMGARLEVVSIRRP